MPFFVELLGFFSSLIGFLQNVPFSPFLFVVISATACLFLPVTFFPIAGGVLFGFWLGLLCNFISATLGSSLAYWVAARWGSSSIRRLLGHRAASLDRFSHRRHSFPALLVLRLVGFPPFGLTNYLSGLSGMPYGSYLGATALGIFPWTVLITYFAAVLWEVALVSGKEGFAKALSQYTAPLLGAAVALAGLIVLGLLLRNKLRKTEGVEPTQSSS